ncbi:B12-binding domain-containing radical SAM protein [Spirochaetota bacterium]
MKNAGRVLFIIHDVYQEDNHFPLGIGYLASILKGMGSKVKVYCQDLFHYSNEDLAHYLSDEEFDLIGVGFMAARYSETVKPLCKVINQHKKSAWLVLGGYGPSPIPEFMLRDTGADIITIGESEETIGELLKSKINSSPPLSSIYSIAYREGDKVSVNTRRKPIKKIDEIPLPEWSLFPMDKYSDCLNLFNSQEGDRVLGLLTSRGCVGKCTFCYRMETGIRIRSVKKVVEEMKILYDRHGINYFFMQDELFAFSKKRMIELGKELKKNNLKIKYSCDCRVDIFDKDMAQIMVDTGCQFFDFGFESADQTVLNNLRKGTTVEQNINAAEIVTSFKNIGIGLNFLWGNIGDSEKTLRKNIDFIKRFNQYHQVRTIRPVTPYPGSQLYDYAIEKGLLKGPGDFFKKFVNSDLFTVNFTDMPDKEYYEILLKGNKELINDHFKHTSNDMEQAENLINNFRDLYTGKINNFRGARHYDKKKNK